jgi:hypothetical protein
MVRDLAGGMYRPSWWEPVDINLRLHDLESGTRPVQRGFEYDVVKYNGHNMCNRVKSI